jgi:hypothetical protein
MRDTQHRLEAYATQHMLEACATSVVVKKFGAFVFLLSNPVAVLFLSFIFGMAGNAILSKMSIYERLSDRYLFSGSKPYESLGVVWYRNFLLATPLRFFNSNIRFSGNPDLATLNSVMNHMKDAEVSHWFGFAAMLVLNCVAAWYFSYKVVLGYVVLNILGNLYPCLLQQYNRRRLTRVVNSIKRRNVTPVN